MASWIKWQHQWDATVNHVRRSIGGGDRQNAEDLVNSALVKMIRSPRADIAHQQAYVQTIALNLHRDDKRRAGHARMQTIGDASWENVPDTAPLPEDVCDARDRVRQLATLFGQLTPRAREIVMMNRVDGLSFREIGINLGISKSAVEKSFYRAMLFLTTASHDR